MKSSIAKCWDATKFGVLLGLKFWPRVIASVFAGAFRGLVSEADKLQAEINAYNVRVFGEPPWSKRVKG